MLFCLFCRSWTWGTPSSSRNTGTRCTFVTLFLMATLDQAAYTMYLLSSPLAGWLALAPTGKGVGELFPPVASFGSMQHVLLQRIDSCDSSQTCNPQRSWARILVGRRPFSCGPPPAYGWGLDAHQKGAHGEWVSALPRGQSSSPMRRHPHSPRTGLVVVEFGSIHHSP